MNKKINNFLLSLPILVLIATFVLINPNTTKAATPTVAATSVGGDAVQLVVTGDANSSVILNYQSTNSSNAILGLGSTNSSGQYTATINSGTYSIVSGSQFTVSVNSQVSQSYTWPYQSGSTGSFAYSQNNLSMSIGQSQSVTANNSYSGGLFLSSNSNPSIANASIVNNQITVYANTAGTTSMNLCSVTNTSYCAVLSVTVVGSSQSLTFSQTSPTITPGQSLSVTVSGGSGTYSVTGNTNSSILQAYMNGASLVLYALGSTGNSAVTVCSTNSSNCGVINVTVGSSSNTSGSLSFSQTSITLRPNQAGTITISGGLGAYSLSSNSNQTAVQAGVSSNQLNLYGMQAGSANVIVCSSGYGCGTVVVTVSSSGTSYPTLSQTSVSVGVGQSATVTVSGGSSYYISTNSNPSIATAGLNNSVVTINGVSQGTSNLAICQTGGTCSTLQITVTNTTVPSTNFSIANILSVGQGLAFKISGGSLPYTISPTSNAYFTASLVGGDAIALIGKAAGSAPLSVCSQNGSCTTLNFIVSGTTGGNTNTGGATTGKYKFYNPLKLGDENQEVMELQKRLVQDGYLTATPTGYYGNATVAAIKKFQSANGLAPLGNLGPGSREILNSK